MRTCFTAFCILVSLHAKRVQIDRIHRRLMVQDVFPDTLGSSLGINLELKKKMRVVMLQQPCCFLENLEKSEKSFLWDVVS